MKHLIGWVRAACGHAKIDARCHRFPSNHNICLFMNGISHLSHVTGTKHDQISHFLLALVTDICLPGGQFNAQLVHTVRVVLDFIYLARYLIHTFETLAQMDDTLQALHDNCDIFISLGVHAHFNIPKLHNISHYLELIELFGTADNFNTEYTEHLHINMAKEPTSKTSSHR
jgi:hypothetical protein